MIDYSRLPEHMQDSARLYIENGIPFGSFMTAVFSNDLTGAYRRADDVNTTAMIEWVRFLLNEAPIGCWGSKDSVDEWIKAGGMNGILGEKSA